MGVNVLDCRGMACPRPVIETKKALEVALGDSLVVIVDNQAARENVTRFVSNAGRKVDVEDKDGSFHLLITGPGGESPAATMQTGQSITCEHASGRVYFITTSALGQGSPDLGAVLMKSLMVTLADQQAPPAALLFLNTGVQLAVEGSPVLELLQMMAGAGAEILVCGTCLDYYKIRDKLAVGVVSNMYDIHSRLAGPDKVITVA